MNCRPLKVVSCTFFENGAKAALLLSLFVSVQTYSFSEAMACKYGERGSLTAICYNATPDLFTNTSYRFDHLDETLLCMNCKLTVLKAGTFDISGNRIQVLDLSDSNIIYIYDRAFTGLVFLEKLILSHNNIHRTEQLAFHGARKLKQLYLDHALGLPFALAYYVFQELPLLKELYLRNNSLLALRDKVFYGLENLEILDVSHNYLGLLHGTLGPLKSLKVISLENNTITKIMATDFLGLQNLLEINLANNYIEEVNFNLTQPNSLRKLNLSKNRLRTHVLEFGAFKAMQKLEVLDLSLNWFETIPPKLFQGLYSLRVLDLSGNIINLFQTGAFSGLPSLRVINLADNHITKVEVTGRLPLHQLNVIDLHANKITDIDYVRFVQRAPKLVKINLDGNLMNCKQCRQLEEYLKKKNIQFTMDLKSCPQLDEAGIKELRELIQGKTVESNDGSNSAITILKILFLVLITMLIGLLYFIHFFILIPRKY